MGAALALGAGACGGGGGERPAGTIRLEPPGRPTATGCAARALATSARADDLVPAPGTYRYRVRGRRVQLGASERSRRLPGEGRVIVTPERRFGKVRCFRFQRRYTEALGDTVTFAVRGPDIFLTSLLFQTGGQITDIRPDPPVLSLPADQLEWSGSFGGPTRGRYAASVIGRRTMRVGGSPVKTVGVEIRLSFAGQVRGTLRSEQWLSVNRHIPIAQTVEQRRDFGLDRLRLTYRSRLMSLHPTAK